LGVLLRWCLRRRALPERLSPARPRRRLVAACMLRDRASGHRGLCGRPRQLSRPTSERLCGTRCGGLGCRTFSGFRRCGAFETACRTTDTFGPRNTPAQSRSPCRSQSQLMTAGHPLALGPAVLREGEPAVHGPPLFGCRRESRWSSADRGFAHVGVDGVVGVLHPVLHANVNTAFHYLFYFARVSVWKSPTIPTSPTSSAGE
jgi:hypothetical protein